jgi:hypothetical protein
MNKFEEILKSISIDKPYIENTPEELKQCQLKSSIDIEEAFYKGLKGLFIETKNTDNFYNIITNAPDAFGLEANPSPEVVKTTIIKAINDDVNAKFALLPTDLENSKYDFSIFPPENGESVLDYWIWYIKCDFFPGPYWMLVRRDGTSEGYSYGFL